MTSLDLFPFSLKNKILKKRFAKRLEKRSDYCWKLFRRGLTSTLNKTGRTTRLTCGVCIRPRLAPRSTLRWRVNNPVNRSWLHPNVVLKLSTASTTLSSWLPSQDQARLRDNRQWTSPGPSSFSKKNYKTRDILWPWVPGQARLRPSSVEFPGSYRLTPEWQDQGYPLTTSAGTV